MTEDSFMLPQRSTWVIFTCGVEIRSVWWERAVAGVCSLTDWQIHVFTFPPKQKKKPSLIMRRSPMHRRESFPPSVSKSTHHFLLRGSYRSYLLGLCFLLSNPPPVSYTVFTLHMKMSQRWVLPSTRRSREDTVLQIWIWNKPEVFSGDFPFSARCSVQGDCSQTLNATVTSNHVHLKWCYYKYLWHWEFK